MTTAERFKIDTDSDLDAFVKLIGDRDVFLTTLPPTGEQIARNGSIKRTVQAMDARGTKGVYWCINPLRPAARPARTPM